MIKNVGYISIGIIIGLLLGKFIFTTKVIETEVKYETVTKVDTIIKEGKPTVKYVDRIVYKKIKDTSQYIITDTINEHVIIYDTLQILNDKLINFVRRTNVDSLAYLLSNVDTHRKVNLGFGVDSKGFANLTTYFNRLNLTFGINPFNNEKRLSVSYLLFNPSKKQSKKFVLPNSG